MQCGRKGNCPGLQVRKMEEAITIHFELLGTFSCGEASGGGNGKNTAAGRKAMSVLQYLIVNHTRNISSQELIGQFWADQSIDPANALKNMVFKVRSILKAMFPDQENMLITLPGCYAWNPALRLELDSERFERACMEAKGRSGEEVMEKLLEAVFLYKGDFLSGNDSDWALSLRRYYQTLYLDACKEVLPVLQKQERWTELLGICEQACSVDFATDDFVVYQMQALTAIGQPGRAVERYKIFREMLWQEFEIAPAEHVEQAYALASSMCRDNRDDQDILEMVAEGKTDRKAFFCTFGTFRNIVALEKRHLLRTQGVSTLVIVSLGNKVTPTTDARRLEKVLLEGLRVGDPVARVDAASYILLLTGTSVENAEIVTERINRTFHKAYSHSRACISFRMSALKPDTAILEQ